MTTQTMTLSFVLLGAGILAVIAVSAVQIARFCSGPVCPVCGVRKVRESGVNNLECQFCGHKWKENEPKRFGRHGGADL